MPGRITVTLYKVYDGTMTQMGKPAILNVSCGTMVHFKTKDLACQRSFLWKATVMIKATQEMNDQLAGIESKLKNYALLCEHVTPCSSLVGKGTHYSNKNGSAAKNNDL